MKNHRIEIVEQRRASTDSERDYEYVSLSCLFADRTEEGGRENVYASRIVGENEVIYSIRWRPGIRASMFIRDCGDLRRITGVQEEGFRQTLHIRATKDNTGDGNGS